MGNVVDPKRSLVASYPYRLTIETQFSDMDVAGHINNLAIARFYESARARFQLFAFDNRNFFGEGKHAAVVAEVRLRYLAEANFPDPVEVGSGIARIGNSSYDFHQALFQNGVCVGLCDCVMVQVHRGKPTPILQEVRERMQAMLMPH